MAAVGHGRKRRPRIIMKDFLVVKPGGACGMGCGEQLLLRHAAHSTPVRDPDVNRGGPLRIHPLPAAPLVVAPVNSSGLRVEPGRCVAEVEAAGAVESFLWGAGREAAGQDGLVVVVVAGAVDREGPSWWRIRRSGAGRAAKWCRRGVGRRCRRIRRGSGW
jgi:hypothetical protein